MKMFTKYILGVEDTKTMLDTLKQNQIRDLLFFVC